MYKSIWLVEKKSLEKQEVFFAHITWIAVSRWYKFKDTSGLDILKIFTEYALINSPSKTNNTTYITLTLRVWTFIY